MGRFISFTALSLTDDMSNDFVWFSYSLLRSNNIYGVELDDQHYSEKRFVNTVKKSKKGERLFEEDYPKKICIERNAKFKESLPLFRLGGAWAVNSSFF